MMQQFRKKHLQQKASIQNVSAFKARLEHVKGPRKKKILFVYLFKKSIASFNLHEKKPPRKIKLCPESCSGTYLKSASCHGSKAHAC